MLLAVAKNEIWVYPERKNIVWKLGRKYFGYRLQDIPKYYFEWYTKNGYDDMWVEIAVAWLTSIESRYIYGSIEHRRGLEEIANNSKPEEDSW